MSSTESLDPQIRGDSLPILLPTESALGKRNFRSNDNDFDQHFLQLGGPRKRLNTRDGIDDVRYDHNFSGNDHDAEEAEEAGLSLLLAASLLQQNEMTSIVEEILDSTIRDARPCGGGNTTSMRQNQPLFFHSLPATNGNKDAIYPSHSLNTTKNKSADSFLTAITGTVTNDLVFISSDSDSVTANVHTATLTRPMPSDVLCGRGGGINKHVGNMIYRRIVEYNKAIYRQVPKRQRMLVSQSIVETILKEGGRFLQDQQQKGAPKNSGGASSVWIEISSRRAVQKTSQALRERSDSFIDDTNGVDMTTPKTASILESLAQGSKRPVKSCVPL